MIKPLIHSFNVFRTEHIYSSKYINLSEATTLNNKLTAVVGTRFDGETHELIITVSLAQGIAISDFIRRATRRELARLQFLPPESRKALEVGGEQCK